MLKLPRVCSVGLVLVVSAGLALVACGSVDQAVSPDAGGTASGRSRSETAEVARDSMREAVRSFPVTRQLELGELRIETLTAQRAAILVGRVKAVAVGRPRVLRKEVLRCETAEGKPTGDLCPQEYAYRMLRIVVDPESAEPDAGGYGLLPEPDATIEITVEPAEQPFDPELQEAITVAARAVSGVRIVAYVVPSADGSFLQLAHPDAMAFVGADGRLEPVDVSGSSGDTALLGSQFLVDLPHVGE